MAALSLSACAAEIQWSKPGSGAAQMLRDQAYCRNLASIEAEKELRLDQESLRHSPSDSGEGHRARMMAFNALKHRNRLVERCMYQHGYQKAKP